MGKKDEKTNVMRLLDEKGIEYRHYSYDGEGLDGNAIAGILGQNPERVFKTLITVGRSGGQSRRGEIPGDAAAEAASSPDRLCAWGLLSHGAEKAVPRFSG